MLTTHWQPVLRNEWNALWGDVNRRLDGPACPAFAGSFPTVCVGHDADNVHVEAELPGLGQGDVEVFVTNGNELTLKGVRRLPEAKGTWHRRERGFGPFARTITLPFAVDADKVEARLEQGVLRVTLPKAEEAKPRRITVKAE